MQPSENIDNSPAIWQIFSMQYMHFSPCIPLIMKWLDVQNFISLSAFFFHLGSAVLNKVIIRFPQTFWPFKCHHVQGIEINLIPLKTQLNFSLLRRLSVFVWPVFYRHKLYNCVDFRQRTNSYTGIKLQKSSTSKMHVRKRRKEVYKPCW